MTEPQRFSLAQLRPSIRRGRRFLHSSTHHPTAGGRMAGSVQPVMQSGAPMAAPGGVLIWATLA